MQDPYFGHRNPLTGEILPSRSRDEWIDWDFALVTAVQLIEDLTDSNGMLAHEVENERMDVLAIKKTNKFKAAVDRATRGTKKKGYTPDPGEYFIPKLLLRGGEWPTLEEFWQSLVEEGEEDTVQ